MEKCLVPISSLYIDHNGDIFPCYEFQSKEPSGTIYKGNLDDYFSNVKTYSIEDKRCIKCKLNEEILLNSSLFNSYKKKFSLDKNKLPQLIMLDINLSNKCNYACRMCSPYFSSTFAKQNDLPVNEKSIDISILLKFISNYIHQIKHINFAGGEPFISDNNFHFLKKMHTITDVTKVSLSYNTNLSVFPPQYIGLWKDFKETTLIISLDSISSKSEYIRIGQNWKKTLRNIHSFSKYKFINLKFHISITPYNVLSWLELVELLTNQLNIPPENIEINMVEWPDWSSIRNLSKPTKNKIIKKLNSQSVQYLFSKDLTKIETFILLKINMIKKYLSITSNKDCTNDFLNITNKVDHRTNKNFFSTFPEMKDIFNDH